jgi:lipopolysaccharide export system protein LptA
MRRTRRLLLVLIAGIVSSVAIIYTNQRETQARNAPAVPAVLPASVSSRADNWSWQQTEGSRVIVRVFAQDVRQLVEEQRMELEHVTLQLFHKDGKVFDEVKSAKADFDLKSDHLFSEGEVEITMGVPAEIADPNRARLVHIKTSGVRFDKKTGTATTDRPAAFKFDRGEGKSVGARYDPATRELHMEKDVSLTWFGEKPTDRRMDIEAGSLVYHESESKILLTPWAKFKRDTLGMEAGNSIVTLVNGNVQHIEALQARGTDVQPKRQLQFAADELRMSFNAKGAVEGITGEHNAKLVSTAPGSQTTVDTKRVDLEFEAPDSESILKKALATGGTVVESKPLPAGAAPLPETRVVRSEVIALYMRNAGQEIDRVETESPGTVDFIPNQPGQKKRFLSGERLTMAYGAANQIKSFRAVAVSTRTDAAQVTGKPAPPPSLTWSKDLFAEFDEKTGALQKMEQWDDFRYEEGDRRAKAQKATLTAPKDEITLTGAARVWDPTGSTSADTITTNQKSGDFSANGNVNSTRLPEKKSSQQPGMLSGDDPIYAKAAAMSSTGQNANIRYEGNALMWQGPNRLQAHRITIDRKQGLLTAEGNVVSQLIDKSSEKAGAKKGSPAFTIVKAPKMTYSDKERLAHYTGGSVLDRGNTKVNAREIKAFLKQGDADSSLDRAVADGAVKIVQSTPARTRTGVSEHAEYYAADGRVVLNGGAPELVDTVQGVTRGKQLTWFANNDRLLVEGAQGQPVDTKLLRR